MHHLHDAGGELLHFRGRIKKEVGRNAILESTVLLLENRKTKKRSFLCNLLKRMWSPIRMLPSAHATSSSWRSLFKQRSYARPLVTESSQGTVGLREAYPRLCRRSEVHSSYSRPTLKGKEFDERLQAESKRIINDSGRLGSRTQLSKQDKRDRASTTAVRSLGIAF